MLLESCLLPQDEPHPADQTETPRYRVDPDHSGTLDRVPGFHLDPLLLLPPTSHSDPATRPSKVETYPISRHAKRRLKKRIWKTIEERLGREFLILKRNPDFQRLSQEDKYRLLCAIEYAARTEANVTPEQLLSNFVSTGRTGIEPKRTTEETHVGASRRSEDQGTDQPAQIRPTGSQIDGSPVYRLTLAPIREGAPRWARVEVLIGGTWRVVPVGDLRRPDAATPFPPPPGCFAALDGDSLVLAAPPESEVRVAYRISRKYLNRQIVTFRVRRDSLVPVA